MQELPDFSALPEIGSAPLLEGLSQDLGTPPDVLETDFPPTDYTGEGGAETGQEGFEGFTDIPNFTESTYNLDKVTSNKGQEEASNSNRGQGKGSKSSNQP